MKRALWGLTGLALACGVVGPVLIGASTMFVKSLPFQEEIIGLLLGAWLYVTPFFAGPGLALGLRQKQRAPVVVNGFLLGIWMLAWVFAFLTQH